MGTVVYTAAVPAGNHSIVANGGHTTWPVTQSGAFPSTAYTVTQATLTFSIRDGNATYVSIHVYRTDTGADLGWVNTAGNSGTFTMALDAGAAWAGITTISLRGDGGYAGQLVGASGVSIKVTYRNNESSLTLNKTSVEAGGSVTATVTAGDSAYTHRLVYSLGNASASHDLAAGVASDSLTIPMDWLNQFPYADSATMTLTLYTKSGGSVIGQTTAQVTVTCPASVIPVIGSATAASNGSVSVGSGMYVRTRDGVTVTMTGVAETYGVIVATGIAVGGYGGNGYNASGSGNLTLASDALPYAGNVTITCWARDGRGRTTTVTLTITVTDYNAPAVTTLSAQRVDASGNASPSGTLGKRTLAYSVSAVGGSYACSATLTLTQAGTTLMTESSPAASDWLQSGGSNIALDLSKEYVLQLTLTDNYTTVARSVTIPTAQAVLSITPAFDGVAFGMVADQSAAVEVSPEWGLRIHGKEILDLIYPVGSYFWSSIATSPASLFGGTWERIQDRFFYCASSSVPAGTYGGTWTHVHSTQAHVLTASEMPYHSHGFLDYWQTTKGTTTAVRSCVAVNGDSTGLSGSGNNSRSYTAAAGGNAAHAHGDTGAAGTLPPFIAEYCWHRTA